MGAIWGISSVRQILSWNPKVKSPPPSLDEKSPVTRQRANTVPIRLLPDSTHPSPIGSETGLGDDTKTSNPSSSDISDSPTPAMVVNTTSGSAALPMIGTDQSELHGLISDSSDLPIEMAPVYSAINTQVQKFYLEGYFLKLHDLDNNGQPKSNRAWVECYAQLVGTVLLLWDASALDQADTDIQPMEHIRILDGSLKIIDSLPTGVSSNKPLTNVLSVSSAGKNRHLFHFNSSEFLHRWTAAIRLSIFESTCLQENYTGALISSKGLAMNSISTILRGSSLNTENWAKVRFGAGTPWRRYWYVISPPSGIEAARVGKEARKHPFARSQRAVGTIKFYRPEERKITKKTIPVATMTNAYSAYAVFPGTHALSNSSTLVKIEGTITVGSDPKSETDGFVFVMPEPRLSVSGAEVMFQFLVPLWDAFSLYGRPIKLEANPIMPHSLLFCQPVRNQPAYECIPLDKATETVTENASSSLSEQEWRKKFRIVASRHIAKPFKQRMRSASNASGPQGFVPTTRNRSDSDVHTPLSNRTSFHSSNGHSRTQSDSSGTSSGSNGISRQPVIPEELIGTQISLNPVLEPPGFSQTEAARSNLQLRAPAEFVRRNSGLDLDTTKELQQAANNVHQRDLNTNLQYSPSGYEPTNSCQLSRIHASPPAYSPVDSTSFLMSHLPKRKPHNLVGAYDTVSTSPVPAGSIPLSSPTVFYGDQRIQVAHMPDHISPADFGGQMGLLVHQQSNDFSPYRPAFYRPVEVMPSQSRGAVNNINFH